MGNKITSGWSRAGVVAAAMFGGLLASSAAQALPVYTVDGIGFGSSANRISTDIWETVVTAPGQTLTGVGRVSSISSSSCGPLDCWDNGGNGRELTFTFSYKVEKITLLGGGQAQGLFSGGLIKFYSDSTPDFSASNPTTVNASDGNLWMTLVGGPTGTACDVSCFSGASAVITLESNFTVSGSNLALVNSGSGHGFLDVLLGGPNALVDTTFDTDGLFGRDIDLSSSFNKNISGTSTSRANFPLTGTAALQQPIPEPGTLLLLGTGLMSLAGARFGKRRRTRS